MSTSASCTARRLALLCYNERSSLNHGSGIVAHRKWTSHSSRRPLQVRHVAYSQYRPAKALGSLEDVAIHKETKDRKNELDQSGIEQYPRGSDSNFPKSSIDSFTALYGYLEPGNSPEENSSVVVAGRISSIRKSGGKLAFVDIVEEPGHKKLQLLLNLGSMNGAEKKAFSDRVRLIRRGDLVSASGTPYRSSSGELSLRVSALPTMLSPCLHIIPSSISRVDVSSDSGLLDRHVEMLTDPSILDTLIARSDLLRTMRKYFESRAFHEVQTPILAAAAGGAIARPFETTATEFSDRKLSLRIAPELWLKRLILGGMPKVFEIGPSFRNEGLDKTHNPEFTTCEFYATYHTLPQLQQLTEQLLKEISAVVKSELDQSFFDKFEQIDFIPALNAHLSAPLPNLSSPTAQSEMIEIFTQHSISLPSRPTLPRLLDKLCSRFLEPTCTKPTWIINIPECLSPLAKSFIHPTAPNFQAVAARAELFINQREIVNCYEEENSPFEQRRKFVEQQRYAQVLDDGLAAEEDDEAMKVDEDYLRALEWGLPPTGGWGCGIDRLVMLFTGKERISDVLSFGNLRAVTRGAEKWEKQHGEHK